MTQFIMDNNNITRQDIAKLAGYAKGTRYQNLMDGIVELTNQVESLYASRGEEELIKFQSEYNLRFHNLYSRLFESIMKMPTLPEYGKDYSVSTERSQKKRAEHMSTCIFIDGEPKLLTSHKSINQTTALDSIRKKLPEGYGVELVLITSEGDSVIKIGDDAPLYLVRSINAGFNLSIGKLYFRSAEQFPLAILSENQCDINHVEQFAAGYLEAFSSYYAQCDWKVLLSDFQHIMYSKFMDYCRIWSYHTQVSKNKFYKIVESCALHKHNFNDESVFGKLFLGEAEKIKHAYMKSFCSLYREKMTFPTLAEIQQAVGTNRNEKVWI